MGTRPLKAYLGLALILTLTLTSYLNTVDTPFHFDDNHSIVFNRNIRDIRNIPYYFIRVHMDSEKLSSGYRPIITTSVALNYRAGGFDPRGYHIFNIAAHLAAVAVFFLIALFFAGKTGQDAFVALIATGIFALHPVHTNAVSYVIARSAVVCAFFYLSAFYLYIRYRESGGRLRLGFCAASFIAALLSKEIGVTVPLVLFLYDLLVLREKRIKSYAVPAAFLVVSAVFSLIRIQAYDSVAAKASSLLAQPYVLSSYLKLFVLPFNLNFLPMVKVPHSLGDATFIISSLVILTALSAIVVISRKDPLTAFLLGWFFITLIPETFADIYDLMIEYRVYLPSAGLSLAVIPFSAAITASGPRARRAAAYFAVAAIAMFSLLVFERNKVYVSDVVLWEDVVKKSPGSGEAHAMLGTSYLKANRTKDAVKAFDTAFYLDPDMMNASDYYNNFGMALDLCGEYGRALEIYKKAMEHNPGSALPLRNAAILLMKMDRRGEAVEYIRKALILQPDNYVLQTLLRQLGG